jgi:lipopolysaccharide biosynthesis glycosyltransferase
VPNDVAIVFAADGAYARGLAVAIHSALAHLSTDAPPEVYILDAGLTESSRARLCRVIDRVPSCACVHWVKDPRDAVRTRRGTLAWLSPTYLRLLVPEVLPHHVKRAVYLDADVLVRRDLMPLLEAPLDGAALGAVRDHAMATTAHPWAGIDRQTDHHPYFNAGVLVIDVEGWRSRRLGDRMLEYVADQAGTQAWDDQGALNAVLESWHELDLTWNVQLLNLAFVERLPPTVITEQLVAQRRTLVHAGAVLHFVGPNPWSTKSTVGGTGQWVLALLRTGWYSPGQAVLWLVPWASSWIPRRCLWLMRLRIAQFARAPWIASAVRAMLPRRRAPTAG